MKNIKTIPNIVTLVRFLLTPIIFFLIIKNEINLAVVIFMVATLLDKLDGYLARKLKQETHHGATFDAFTDTVLIFSVLMAMYIKSHISTNLFMFLLAPKIITGLFLLSLHKAAYIPTIFSRLSSVSLYIITIVILLDFHKTVLLILISLLYLFSLIHWVKLIKTR